MKCALEMSFGSAVASGASALWVIGEEKRSSVGSRRRGSTWWSPPPLLATFHTFKVHWVLLSSAAPRLQPRGINAALVFCRIKHECSLEWIFNKSSVALSLSGVSLVHIDFSAGGAAVRAGAGLISS